MVAVAAHGQQEDVRQQSADSAILLQAQPAKVATVQGHNPTKALLLSLIPGAGQIYNGHWEVLAILSTTTTPTWLLSKKNTFNV